MKNKILLSLFLLLKGNMLSAYPSLLLTEEEVNHIRESLSGREKGNLEESFKGKNLYLSAIIYVDESNWSLWLNNKIIRPETLSDIDGFHLEKVTPQGAKFSWTPPDTVIPATFTLHPYQTYLTKNQKIVDGREN